MRDLNFMVVEYEKSGLRLSMTFEPMTLLSAHRWSEGLGVWENLFGEEVDLPIEGGTMRASLIAGSNPYTLTWYLLMIWRSTPMLVLDGEYLTLDNGPQFKKEMGQKHIRQTISDAVHRISWSTVRQIVSVHSLRHQGTYDDEEVNDGRSL